MVGKFRVYSLEPRRPLMPGFQVILDYFMTFPLIISEISARYYFTCCCNGKYHGNPNPRKTTEKRPHQKETRKLNSTCISRMYVNELKDGQITVKYVSAHTGHDLGPQEVKYLPLPESTKQEVSTKISMGIPPERILHGKLAEQLWVS